jgi:hypothetical protein
LIKRSRLTSIVHRKNNPCKKYALLTWRWTWKWDGDSSCILKYRVYYLPQWLSLQCCLTCCYVCMYNTPCILHVSVGWLYCIFVVLFFSASELSFKGNKCIAFLSNFFISNTILLIVHYYLHSTINAFLQVLFPYST